MEWVCKDSEFHLPECSDYREGRTDALVFEVRDAIILEMRVLRGADTKCSTAY